MGVMFICHVGVALTLFFLLIGKIDDCHILKRIFPLYNKTKRAALFNFQYNTEPSIIPSRIKKIIIYLLILIYIILLLLKKIILFFFYVYRGKNVKEVKP